MTPTTTPQGVQSNRLSRNNPRAIGATISRPTWLRAIRRPCSEVGIVVAPAPPTASSTAERGYSQTRFRKVNHKIVYLFTKFPPRRKPGILPDGNLFNNR